jgi:hypothetical protein
MQTITTIGLDIAKSVFQVHGIDVEGNAVQRRQIKRRYVVAFFQKLPPCLVDLARIGLGAGFENADARFEKATSLGITVTGRSRRARRFLPSRLSQSFRWNVFARLAARSPNDSHEMPPSPIHPNPGSQGQDQLQGRESVPRLHCTSGKSSQWERFLSGSVRYWYQ